MTVKSSILVIMLTLVLALAANQFGEKTSDLVNDGDKNPNPPVFKDYPDKNFALRLQNEDIEAIPVKIQIDGKIIIEEYIDPGKKKDIFLSLENGKHTFVAETSISHYSSVSPLKKEFNVKDKLWALVSYRYINPGYSVQIPWYISVEFSEVK